MDVAGIDRFFLTESRLVMYDQMKLVIPYLISGTRKIERRSGDFSKAENLFVKLLSSLKVCYGNAYVMYGFDNNHFPLFF
jgi:hypothetical protein